MDHGAAGSVNYPFDESLIHLPHIIKKCKQHTSSSQVDSSASRQKPEADQEPSESSLAQGGLQDTATTTKNDSLHADSGSHDVVVVCRRGNDSQHIVQSLREHGVTSAVDLIGGLSAWSRQADKSFPQY